MNQYTKSNRLCNPFSVKRCELGQVCDFNLLQIMRLNDGTDR